MKRLLVHIGTGKTGSTSIQTALAAIEQDGRFPGDVNYPLISGRKHHQHLVLLYKPYEGLPRGLKRLFVGGGPDYEQCVEQLREQYLKQLSESRNVILSAEYLSSLSDAQIARFKADLDTCGFHDPLILLYVREPASYYLSLIQQQLKAAFTFTSPHDFEYGIESLARSWLENFPGKVKVRAFEPTFLKNRCVVQDLLAVASEHFSVGFDLAASDVKRSNESISAEAMIALQRYRRMFYEREENCFKPDSDRLLRYLQRSIPGLSQTKPALKPEVRRLILAKHRSDLEFLKEEFGIAFPGVEDDMGCDAVSLPRRAFWSVEDVVQDHDPEVVVGLALSVLRMALK